jgi:hypothetical protein
MLQLEANIDPSSAGGPLFNSSGEVLGIITHGMPPLVNAFDNLFQSFDRTIATLSGARFFAAPSQAIIAIQQDMKEVARQLQRYATPGVGFAIACDTIKTESIWSGGIDDGGQPIQT